MVVDIDDNVEIERRWRFLGPAEILEPLQGIYSIQQYYLTAGFRLRINGNKYAMTVKQAVSNVLRREWEIEIPKWVFQQLLFSNPGAISIDKIRSHLFIDDGSYLEVDIFIGSLSGLILLEKEFKSTEEANKFSLPFWIKEYVQEVTQYPEFTNFCLAKAGKIPNITIGI